MGDERKSLAINFLQDVIWPIFCQESRKLRASLGHAITTSLATGIVLALFLYIFGDFIKDKLPTVSESAAAKALEAFLLAIILFSFVSIIRWIQARLYGADSWFSALKSFGLHQKDLSQLRLRTAALLAAIGGLLVAVVLDNFVGKLSTLHWVSVPFFVGIALLYLRVTGDHAKVDVADQPPSAVKANDSPLVAWRISRLKRTSWRGSNLRILAALPILFGAFNLILNTRPELPYICSLTGGIILSWTAPLLVDEDLQTTWIERQAAVSHDDWIGAWQRIFTWWALRIFATTLILTALAQTISWSRSGLIMSGSWTSAFKIAVINGILAAFPIWIAPAFVMQIDGKRPMTNIIMITLVNLFLGTALIAVPYAAPLLYLLQREALRYQGGRFARGSYN